MIRPVPEEGEGLVAREEGEGQVAREEGEDQVAREEAVADTGFKLLHSGI